jgi:hypothetical protein
VVDLDEDGYSLTSKQDGVLFDIDGDGHKDRIGWIAGNANDGLLAIDRNGNGRIDDGTELLSNVINKSTGVRALNGFDALLDFYRTAGAEKGGVIDAANQVYADLRLWIDANHDGVSQTSELRSLPTAGIISISTIYSLLPTHLRITESGNLMMYRGTVFISRRGVDFPRPMAYVQFSR